MLGNYESPHFWFFTSPFFCLLSPVDNLQFYTTFMELLDRHESSFTSQPLKGSNRPQGSFQSYTRKSLYGAYIGT